MKITVESVVKADLDKVWSAWNSPEDIKRWNAADDSWHCPSAAVDLREGGKFSARMEAKDGSMGFDFEGKYTKVVPKKLIEYVMGDDRVVLVEFSSEKDGVRVRETFDAENVYSADQQKQGWQSILDRFAKHVEAKKR